MADALPSSWSDETLSLLTGENASYLTHLYDVYCHTPTAVSEEWRTYFKTLEEGSGPTPLFEKSLSFKEDARVDELIQAYRGWGHLFATLDPLKLSKRPLPPELDPKTYGLADTHTKSELGRTIKRFQSLYCGNIGFQFLHVPVLEERIWLQDFIEKGKDPFPLSQIPVSPKDQKQILQKLMESCHFEAFLNKKFPGVMRFSLEGAESIVPALEAALEQSVTFGIRTVVMGMPHRGRLNILANILEKPLKDIFAEFTEQVMQSFSTSGDVKYHRGTSTDRVIQGHTVHLSLMPNPSHLEFIDPVVLGKVRALQDQTQENPESPVMGLLIHGDAAFIGQGVAAESLMLSHLKGYKTGGTLHVVINNQIGFTTNPGDGRSSLYCSDFALAIGAPIFHVNGDDPEAVVRVLKLASLYRHTFKKDVVVDLVCYRRQGHNEGDEASFTQPFMNQTIKNHPSVLEIYQDTLIAKNNVTRKDVEERESTLQKRYQKAFESWGSSLSPLKETGKEEGQELLVPQGKEKPVLTGVHEKTLHTLAIATTQVPQTFHLHPKVRKLLSSRQEMAHGKIPVDWAMAETLAFASLLEEGYPVRLTGQDTERGTFSQRHGVLVDQTTEETYIPLQHLSLKQAPFEIWNSPLAESSILGFEVGYSLAAPRTLVAWEAQYGDFANGAQVIIDGFLASGEAKWEEKAGLVLLLPHGLEGRGPDHSSARVERFLQLCAENNMTVVNPTTPANYFHILRKHLIKNERKPLIIFTPKSLLRHKLAVSSLKDFETKTFFQPILSDSVASATRVVVCSGKVYYDLLAVRESQKIQDIALLRLEQLYPFPHTELVQALKPYKGADLIWCQEEPMNMGPWTFIALLLESVLQEADLNTSRPLYKGRPPSSSPATGFFSRHEEEQALLIAEALNLPRENHE